MPRLFISHTMDSRDYARRLAEALKALGDAPQFDLEAIKPGQSFSKTIRANLASSDYIVVLLTERAAKSPSVMFEIGAAEGLGKRVIPILLADIDIDMLDYIRRDRWFLDAKKLSPTQTAQRIKALTEQHR